MIRDLIATRDPAIFRPEPDSAEEVVDTRERNANGQFKSEFQTWSETHSSAECTERARQDSAYRSWRQDQYAPRAFKMERFVSLACRNVRQCSTSANSLQISSGVQCGPAQNTRPRGGFVNVGPNPPIHSSRVHKSGHTISQARPDLKGEQNVYHENRFEK